MVRLKLKVIVISPRYQINLGYIARVSKNFGISNLVLVNPRCKHIGKQAIKYSKHARELLERAVICKSLAEATRGTFTIGTTGIWHKTNESFYNVFPIERFSQNFGSLTQSQDVSLVLGRDDTGMTKDELKQCDATIFIKTNQSYPILNISHALAIMLYEFTKHEMQYEVAGRMASSSADRDAIVRLFSTSISANKQIRNKAGVAMALKHILNRAAPTKKELSALAIAFTQKKR